MCSYIMITKEPLKPVTKQCGVYVTMVTSAVTSQMTKCRIFRVPL